MFLYFTILHNIISLCLYLCDSCSKSQWRFSQNEHCLGVHYKEFLIISICSIRQDAILHCYNKFLTKIPRKVLTEQNKKRETRHQNLTICWDFKCLLEFLMVEIVNLSNINIEEWKWMYKLKWFQPEHFYE